MRQIDASHTHGRSARTASFGPKPGREARAIFLPSCARRHAATAPRKPVLMTIASNTGLDRLRIPASGYKRGNSPPNTSSDTGRGPASAEGYDPCGHGVGCDLAMVRVPEDRHHQADRTLVVCCALVASGARTRPIASECEPAGCSTAKLCDPASTPTLTKLERV
jgi:hypothetical protein